MCCFSKPVKLVADTNIFARASASGRQFLVYSMKVAAPEELAMILPIPVPAASSEDAVKFINLEKYANFFDDVNAGFPLVLQPTKNGGRSLSAAGGLKVVEVGSFVASFVPAIKDFSRLDARFRLPTGVWSKLPQYKDWGFAVFQLKKGERKIHPMAFEFPRRNLKSLFFPTVHIHDGSVPSKAKFDHLLFCQQTGGGMPMDWEESEKLAETFVKKIDETQGIVAPKEHVYRKALKGMFQNVDVIV